MPMGVGMRGNLKRASLLERGKEYHHRERFKKENGLIEKENLNGSLIVQKR